MTESGNAHRYVQPWLHDLETCVRGNVTALGDASGDMGAPGTGVWVDDRRVLSRFVLTFAGERPAPLASTSRGHLTEVLTALRLLGDPGADPTVTLRRERSLHDGGMRERITVTNRAGQRVCGVMLLEIEADGADIADVKAGRPPRATLPITHRVEGLRWSDARHRTTMSLDQGEPSDRVHGMDWTWELDLAAGDQATLEIDLTSEPVGTSSFPARWGGRSVDWSEVSVRCDDRRVEPLVRRSLDDLNGLLLADPDDEGDVFAAAGTPWYLTLFGRDSLWAARLTLPFGTHLAAGTLRALGRRRGRTVDPRSAEAPGRILHEVRRTAYVDPVTGLRLPPVYYGAVDSTALWVRLLHDAWLWGLAEDEVRALRPALDEAMGWLARSAADGGGILRQGAGDEGLANQGWKDSDDSLRRADGSLAPGPAAFVESQAYAVSAARGAAHLLEDAWGEDGSGWRALADQIEVALRRHFWVDAEVRHLAIALDRDGRPVDGLGSNMGHALGTGALSEAEARRTAHVLSGPDLLGPVGLRTLSRDNPAYNPIGYHTGSVWVHDNAVAALGLAHEDLDPATVLRRIVLVGSALGDRLPELHGGEPLLGRPVPYPASCRPQAWAAASVGALVEAALRLRPDAPSGSLRIRPVTPAPFGAMTVRGLRIGTSDVAVRVDAEGEVLDVEAPGLDVVVG